MVGPKIKVVDNELLSDNWYSLRKYTFDYQTADGDWERQEREAYDRGNGAAILLYNRKKSTVILTRQFRLPTYVNGNPDGMLVEVCAGLLDESRAEAAIRREAEEETGYRVGKLEKVFTAYMSPGSVTEILHFFVAEYDESMRIGRGGGLAEEQENIEVLEWTFERAFAGIANGEIRDAKTIMLLQHAKIAGLL